MSLTTRFLSEQDIDELATELKEWPNTARGNDAFELGVTPFVTFYFLYNTKRYVETSLLMVDIHEEFERLVGKPYKTATHPDSERPHPYGSKRIPDLREYAKNADADGHFAFSFNDETNHKSSPATSNSSWRIPAYQNDRESRRDRTYSSIQLYYRWSWWKDNKVAWRAFVHQTIQKLQPEQVYSGFAMANPLEFGTRSEVAVWERALTPRFYGLDIDSPYGMHRELLWGVRPPTWAFLLSDIWREQLSLTREAVKVALTHPRITTTELDAGLWIELGSEPELYPVESGVPELPSLLNKLLRPVRHDAMGLLDFGEWDGDPNERFTNTDAVRWMRRFDEDSDWPSLEQRLRAPIDSASQSLTSISGGQPCPQAGWWLTPAKAGSRSYFKVGEVMPIIRGSSYGSTFWQWDIDQSGPKL